MKKEIITLVLVAVLWILLRIMEYYMPFFIQALLWLGFSAAFLIVTIKQLIKLIKEIKNIKMIRIVKFFFYGLIFYLTLNRWLILGIIEKADWHILYQKRMEIVEKVQKKELNPIDGNYICELPFEFPIVSHDGNDIIIRRNDSTQTITVEFYVLRNFHSAASTLFIYTNDDGNIKYYDELTNGHLQNNWKMKENWYRIKRK